MNRLKRLFARKHKGILSIYCTAGFPALDSTVPVMQALQDGGADLIELGMPYSDPLADGPVIQASSSQALHNGMNLPLLFSQLKNFRQTIDLPVLLMGYLNPVLQYGLENFCRDAAAAGIDGLILPDVPMYAFEQEYGPVFERYGLDFVFLVTPETVDERVKKLDALSSGFLYAVSSSSTTGNAHALKEKAPYFRKLQEMNLNNNVLIGFGIRDRTSFDEACTYASGAIIGTAYIKALEGAAPESIGPRTRDFLKTIRG